MRHVLILGAAGRDFHNFHAVYRDDPEVRVVAFTATQIPGIAARRYPATLAGPNYPEGIPIWPEEQMPALIASHRVDEVVFAYSDLTHDAVMHLASRALAGGADFRLLGPRSTALRSRRPVVAVCAVRTGVGKSPVTRRVASLLKEHGLRIAVVRHPMPYGDLELQRVQRLATVDDLLRHDCTIEEWEEYESHLEAGSLVFAGVDYHAILEQAEAQAEVILWDGGNNDLPFFQPDLHLTLLDPHRVGHETSYHPGEANLWAADALVITKTDSASPEQRQRLHDRLAELRPETPWLEGSSEILLEAPPGALCGRRVLVVDDGPTLTHGGMPYGAGFLAARQQGCQIVDPRPYLVGSLRDTYRAHPHLDCVVPAMGYSSQQRQELEQTLNAAEVEAVVVGSPVDLTRILTLRHPCFRVRYEFCPGAGTPLEDLLQPVIAKALAQRDPGQRGSADRGSRDDRHTGEG